MAKSGGTGWVGALAVMVVMGVAGSHVSGSAGSSSGHGGGAAATLESLLGSIQVPSSSAAPAGAAGTAIRFAEAQIGKPYVWGGTGPDGFDCSGLTMQSWAAAGISIGRTSEDQWATAQQNGWVIPASQRGPGDLVFYNVPGDTQAVPNHVAMLVSRSQEIEAYATGTPVRLAGIGAPQGEQNIVGYADPTVGG
jgi:cell wall-associated NlpC family hydrolase